MFSLEFDDKYRLWSTVVQGAADRIFIATERFPALGSAVVVQLCLPSQHLEKQLRGTVVGRRCGGDRFPNGVFIRFSSEDLRTCRNHFGLAQDPQRYQRGRRAPRVYRPFPVRFRNPDMSTPCETGNFSQTGALIHGMGALAEGQRVEVDLTLDDGEVLPLSAQVAWVKSAEALAGVRFVEVTPPKVEKLSRSIQRMLRANQEGPTDKRGVVIAEGDEQSLALLQEVLELHRVNVFPAQTGDDAISITRWLKPAVVFLDVLMPGVDAVDVCRLMRADAELADIPVIFFSQLDPTRLHQIADEAGATDYVVKPAIIGELYRLVARYLQSPPEQQKP